VRTFVIALSNNGKAPLFIGIPKIRYNHKILNLKPTAYYKPITKRDKTIT